MVLKNNAQFLIGDVGGSKAVLAICSLSSGAHLPLQEQVFINREHDSLEEIIRIFLDKAGLQVDSACLAVAGPVVEGVVRMTNLPWVISESGLQSNLRINKAKLINDIVALACAVPRLHHEDLLTLQTGTPLERGIKAVMAVGTGFGQAFLTWSGSQYGAYATEGGHVDFAPQNAIEQELFIYCKTEFGHVSYERVCSGPGILNIYNFLKLRGDEPEPDWLKTQLAQIDDPVPAIIENGIERKSELCMKTLDLFVSICGAAAGNQALALLPTGGLYIGGGIPPKILDLFKDEHFNNAFKQKGRMSDLMKHIPIYLILNPKAALWGAAHYGFDHYSDRDD